MALEVCFQTGEIEAGCDEAGRGCLAGPVVAAAVILPDGCEIPGLTDSKKLTENMRIKLRPIIEETAIAWGIGIVSPQEIDEINILQGSFLAMHRAIEKMKVAPKHLLIDGNRFKAFKDIPHRCEVKGDGRFLNIAAASILAKTERDFLMEKLHEDFPVYDWKKNKGYPTPAHRHAISTHGSCEHHRMSFQLLPSQLTLDL